MTVRKKLTTIEARLCIIRNSMLKATSILKTRLSTSNLYEQHFTILNDSLRILTSLQKRITTKTYLLK